MYKIAREADFSVRHYRLPWLLVELYGTVISSDKQNTT